MGVLAQWTAGGLRAMRRWRAALGSRVNTTADPVLLLQKPNTILVFAYNTRIIGISGEIPCIIEEPSPVFSILGAAGCAARPSSITRGRGCTCRRATAWARAWGWTWQLGCSGCGGWLSNVTPRRNTTVRSGPPFAIMRSCVNRRPS